MNRLSSLRNQLHTLVVFRALLDDTVISHFLNMLEYADSEKLFPDECALFEAALFEHGDSWSRYLLNTVTALENTAVRLKAVGKSRKTVDASVHRELQILQDASAVSADAFPYAGSFTPWTTESIDFTAEYEAHLENVARRGYGIYASHHVFTVGEDGLVPVHYPDPQRLSQLPGYEAERKKVLANVQALLAGEPAVNMLLYGDAGTGKSSTIKAIVNEYREEGLRLVEVRKNQLFRIPPLLEQLAELPLKFIVFIDDLSFSSNDDNFASLKAILEGSVSKQASNTIIAATSNRRHLVKESVSERFADDLHESDTRQELLSLSARFGLIVTFQKPDRSRFLYIVHELAEQYGIEATEDLDSKAEAFALRAGGRTPRVAKQFIEQIRSGVL